MFYVYAIQNIDKNKIYIGHTENLVERLKRHNKLLKNKVKSYTSKNSGNWILIYKENCLIRKEAMEREKELKSYQGRLFIKKLLK